ncbi:unnamed protein product [Cylicocyclus nassatus]|uniref:Chitin-binding type-2 domain-containing protein n=1 Tax=Cylicocyclus nassatus TaxID=53992 RepID=A0AA36MFB4_CYLNA|nr:unnamed protein product [Cylicocyclus nassatus]
MMCPSNMVFNEKKVALDYLENCLKAPIAPSLPVSTDLVQSVVQHTTSEMTLEEIDRSGKKNGYYSEGCSSTFVLCNDGVAVTMKCPAPLVFDQKKGQCDYLENCNKKSSPLPLASTVYKPQAPFVPDVVDCTGKPNGYCANGCSPSFAYCLDGVATPMRCPPSSVSKQNKGQCDFAERCSTKVPLPGTVSVPHQTPVPVVQQPARLWCNNGPCACGATTPLRLWCNNRHLRSQASYPSTVSSTVVVSFKDHSTPLVFFRKLVFKDLTCYNREEILLGWMLFRICLLFRGRGFIFRESSSYRHISSLALFVCGSAQRVWPTMRRLDIATIRKTVAVDPAESVLKPSKVLTVTVTIRGADSTTWVFATKFKLNLHYCSGHSCKG